MVRTPLSHEQQIEALPPDVIFSIDGNNKKANNDSGHVSRLMLSKMICCGYR